MLILLPNEGANLLPFLPSFFALPLKLSSASSMHRSTLESRRTNAAQNLDTQCGTLPTNIFLLPHHHLPNHWNQHAPAMLRNIKSRTNASIITSPSLIQSTLYENANSICLAAKFAHMDPTRLPHKFLTAWVSHPRRSGGQHYTLRNSYVETLQHILPNIPDNGTIDSWLPLAQNHEQWKTLGTEWIKHRQALMIYQYGPHPLLGDGILDHQFFWYLQDIHR
jgi:hypothetical protein